MKTRIYTLANSAIILLSACTAFGQNKGAAASPGSAFTSILPMMLIMFVIIYFLMIRPEQKKQKDRMKLLSNIKKGDKVLTVGGIYGIVGSVKDTSVMVKISENNVVEVTKAAISSVITTDGAVADQKSVDKEEKKK